MLIFSPCSISVIERWAMASATAFLMCSRYRCKNLCQLTALLFLALRRRSIMWLIKIPLTETDCDDVLHQFLMVVRTVFGGRIFCRAAIALCARADTTRTADGPVCPCTLAR